MNAEMFPLVAIANEDPNRRYTKPDNVRWIEEQVRIKGWHLDPAADEQSHHAERYFSIVEYATSSGVNGLELSWLPADPQRGAWCLTCEGSGSVPVPRELGGGGKACPTCYENPLGQGCAPFHAILLNPPWDDLERWAAKLWEELLEHWRMRIPVLIAFVVPGDRHEQPWWQRYVEPFRIEKHDWQRRASQPNDVSAFVRRQVEVRVHCPPERWEYNSPGGGSKNNAFFPSAVVEFRSTW